MPVPFDPINFTHIPNRDKVTPGRLKASLKYGDCNFCLSCGERTPYASTRKPPFNSTCSKECRKKYMHDYNLAHPHAKGVMSPEGRARQIAAVKAYASDKEKQAKARKAYEKTMMERYGTVHPLQIASAKAKRKETIKEHFGDENWAPGKVAAYQEKAKRIQAEHLADPVFAQSVKDKRAETNLQRYGVENAGWTEESQTKIKATNLERYGVEWSGANSAIKEEIKESQITTYGYYPHNRLDDQTHKEFERLGKDGFTIRAISNTTGRCRQSIKDYFLSANIPLPAQKMTTPEACIVEWLKENYTGQIVIHDREILKPKEIDIWLPDANLGIEVNGEYWHCENHAANSPIKPKLHIYDKWKEAQKLGIQLLELWGTEVADHFDGVTNLLSSKLQMSQPVFARKCEVKEVTDSSLVIQFVQRNHLQGIKTFTSADKAYGLYRGDNLLAMILFSPHHRQGHENEIVLKRFCCRSGVRIVGGCSKLLKHAIKLNDWHRIITWSDNRISTGKLYGSMGMALEEELSPDYSYWELDTNIIRSKQSCQKSDLHCVEGQTEKERATELGLYRIWDCGKKRWAYTA